MKKVVFSILFVAVAIGQLRAGSGPKKFTQAQLNQTTRLARNSEPTSLAKPTRPGNYGDALDRLRTKRGPGQSNSVQDVSISTLGESVNPFTVIGNGRTNLFVSPALNTVAFVRRGGPNDVAGPDGAPGNRLFYDLNTKGGADGQWQISKGPLYKNDEFDLSGGNNFGARYPQAVLWAPPGSTDTSQAAIFSVAPLLDGTNGTWGGQARGWQQFNGSAAKQTYTGSALADPYHYIVEGMEITSTGKIFFVDPERDVTSGSVIYTNRITVYEMTYNSATNDWDSTITFIPFNATSIASSTIAFSPDGSTGYVAVLATSPDFGITNVYAPFVSKSADGGQTWSSFQLVNINPEFSLSADSLRDKMLGSWVNFRSDGAIVPVEAGSPYSHKVQYTTTFDLDATVDQYNYCHIFTSMGIGGFTDTLEASDPPTIRSGLGIWLADIYLNDPDQPYGFVFDGVQALRGCWGDCAGSENFTEDNRPQTSRTPDGSMLGFCYFDTDTAQFDPVEGNENSNPDLWVRTLRISGPGQYFLSTKAFNKTKGSNAGGQMVCGNVSPIMLPSATIANRFTIPTSAILLSTFDGVTAPWPVTHLYLDGISANLAIDTFPVEVHEGDLSFRLFNPVKEIAAHSRSLHLSLTPNPARSVLMASLTSTNPGNAEIRITNALGQVVEQNKVLINKTDAQIPINVASLRNGIYFLTARLGDQRISKRFVKE